jgi:hypothetical protein
MKKAKIMLSAIAILTVVSATLAFKAKNTHVIYCAPTAGLTCSLNIISIMPATLTRNANGIILTGFCTTATSMPCTIQVPVYRLLAD